MLHTVKSSDDVVDFVLKNLDKYPYLKGKDIDSVEYEVISDFDSYYDDFLDSLN